MDPIGSSDERSFAASYANVLQVADARSQIERLEGLIRDLTQQVSLRRSTVGQLDEYLRGKRAELIEQRRVLRQTLLNPSTYISDDELRRFLAAHPERDRFDPVLYVQDVYPQQYGRIAASTRERMYRQGQITANPITNAYEPTYTMPLDIARDFVLLYVPDRRNYDFLSELTSIILDVSAPNVEEGELQVRRDPFVRC